MKLFKLLPILLVLFLMSACSSKVKQMGDSNIPGSGDRSPLVDINYDYDSYALDDVARRKLRSNAGWLKRNDYTKVVIEGHCDERGTHEYNRALGLKRGHMAREFLIASGIPEKKLSVVSYGEELPLDTRGGEEAWARNRRAHFTVTR